MSEEKNDRFVGIATPALTIRQMWHAAHFKKVDAGTKAHPNRKVWAPLPDAPSLKAFARKLLAAGDATAKAWFDNKHGKTRTRRSEENASKAKLLAQATKAARSKKK